MSKVYEILTWAKRILRYDSRTRLEIADEVLESIRKHVSSSGETSGDKSAGEKIVSMLEDSKSWKLMGFAPNMMYIKADAKTEEDLRSLYVHAWGTETLVFMHRKLPITIMTNPSMRVDKTILHEMKLAYPELKEYLTDIVGGAG